VKAASKTNDRPATAPPPPPCRPGDRGEGPEAVAAGIEPMDLRPRHRQGGHRIVEEIKAQKRRRHHQREIAQVGTISSKGEPKAQG